MIKRDLPMFILIKRKGPFEQNLNGKKPDKKTNNHFENRKEEKITTPVKKS